MRNSWHLVPLFVFSFSEVLAFQRHSRSLPGIFRSSAAAWGSRLLLLLPYTGKGNRQDSILLRLPRGHSIIELVLELNSQGGVQPATQAHWPGVALSPESFSWYFALRSTGEWSALITNYLAGCSARFYVSRSSTAREMGFQKLGFMSYPIFLSDSNPCADTVVWLKRKSSGLGSHMNLGSQSTTG